MKRQAGYSYIFTMVIEIDSLIKRYMKKEKEIVDSLLKGTGVTLNGSNEYDPQIHNEDFYGRVLRDGSLGLGESYMDGWWDCPKLDQFFHKILGANLDYRIMSGWDNLFYLAWNSLFNAGQKSKSFEVGERHYDNGNDLYSIMLDKRLTYTCGYWSSPVGEAKNLNEAQEAKLDLVCKKIGLKSGQKVLDIGSGWGSFIGYAAEKYGISALGITVSKEQKKLADELYKKFPVGTRLLDYRDLDKKEKFDHVISLGMFEHVGYKNYRDFMEVAHNALKDDGLFILQTIGGNQSVVGTDPWTEKYIFPNGMLPSIKQIGESIEGLFVMEDWHNFGTDYDKTLMAWYKNIEDNWDKLKSNYDEKFHRMWRYYLLSFAGLFRSRRSQLWQIVLSKKGVRGGYKSIRP